MARISKAKLKADLILQLEKKRANIPLFLDQIETYMDLWEIKKELKADIKKRGTGYEEISTKGELIWKTNPQNKDLVAVSRQMCAILKELGITTNEIEEDFGEDERL